MEFVDLHGVGSEVTSQIDLNIHIIMESIPTHKMSSMGFPKGLYWVPSCLSYTRMTFHPV